MRRRWLCPHGYENHLWCKDGCREKHLATIDAAIKRANAVDCCAICGDDHVSKFCTATKVGRERLASRGAA